MTDQPPDAVGAPGSLRPGGRTARTRESVLRAVVDELNDNGYAGATVERVAERAGVAKTTIYRRWGSLDGLLADLMAEYAAREIQVPDKGSLDADLHALSTRVVASLGMPALKAAFGMMVKEAATDTAARELLARFLAGRMDTMAVIIDRAIERGELPPHTDAAGVLGTITSVIYYRLYVLGEDVSQRIADSAAATAAAAARAGVHSGSRR
ncbi:MAG TPA: TetR/AcrR family transcriptional regulator [Trebonia sp.]